jgi:hypothetical protein
VNDRLNDVLLTVHLPQQSRKRGQNPETGQKCTGIVTSWLPDDRTAGYGRHDRAVILSNGSGPVVVVLGPGAGPWVGSWRVVYRGGAVEPVVRGAHRSELVS